MKRLIQFSFACLLLSVAGLLTYFSYAGTTFEFSKPSNKGTYRVIGGRFSSSLVDGTVTNTATNIMSGPVTHSGAQTFNGTATFNEPVTVNSNLTVGAVMKAIAEDDSSTNTVINSSGQVVLTGVSALANGKYLLGNGSGVGTEVTLSGDVTSDNAGLTLVTDNALDGMTNSTPEFSTVGIDNGLGVDGFFQIQNVTQLVFVSSSGANTNVIDADLTN